LILAEIINQPVAILMIQIVNISTKISAINLMVVVSFRVTYNQKDIREKDQVKNILMIRKKIPREVILEVPDLRKMIMDFQEQKICDWLIYYLEIYYLSY
jgi:hypothetical protein